MPCHVLIACLFGCDECENVAPPPKKDNSRALLVSFLLMVVIGLGNKIFQVNLLYHSPLSTILNYLMANDNEC
jgi:hypothetical protein